MPESIKNYADNRHVSYEAVRKQIKKYSKELEGLVYKKGRTTFLTEEAIDFLDSHRQDRTIVLEQSNDSERIEMLRTENERLKNMIIELQKQLAKEKVTRISMLETRNNAMLQLETRNSDLDKELNKFHKTVFGLYKKEK